MNETEPIRIALRSDPDAELARAVHAILVPRCATDEPGRIRTLPAAPDSTAKHELHQLSQLALYDFEDGELAPVVVAAGEAIVATWSGGAVELVDGLAILRDPGGAPAVIAHADQPVRALLSAAHRYCTRWVRLDVR